MIFPKYIDSLIWTYFCRKVCFKTKCEKQKGSLMEFFFQHRAKILNLSKNIPIFFSIHVVYDIFSSIFMHLWFSNCLSWTVKARNWRFGFWQHTGSHQVPIKDPKVNAFTPVVCSNLLKVHCKRTFQKYLAMCKWIMKGENVLFDPLNWTEASQKVLICISTKKWRLRSLVAVAQWKEAKSGISKLTKGRWLTGYGFWDGGLKR